MVVGQIAIVLVVVVALLLSIFRIWGEDEEEAPELERDTAGRGGRGP